MAVRGRPFAKGNAGRPKGAVNRATREVKGWLQKFLESRSYRESAAARVLSGKAPHLESLWHLYVYGRPVDPQPSEIPTLKVTFGGRFRPDGTRVSSGTRFVPVLPPRTLPEPPAGTQDRAGATIAAPDVPDIPTAPARLSGRVVAATARAASIRLDSGDVLVADAPNLVLGATVTCRREQQRAIEVEVAVPRDRGVDGGLAVEPATGTAAI
jgi:hypothetical protein